MPATDPAAPVVVSDAGPLIHLDELGCVDLLADFASVLVPEAVWSEVHIHRPSALTHARVNLVRVSPSSSEENTALKALARSLVLHAGELEALRIALDDVRSLRTTPRLDWQREIWASRYMAPLASWFGRFAAANERPAKSWPFSDHCLSSRLCT